MKKFLLIAMVLFFSISAFSADNVIRVRVSEFPPLYYMDDSGKWTGLDVELADAVIKEAGFKAKYIPTSWVAGLLHIEKGSLDMMMNMGKTAERSKYADWIGPERNTQMVLVVREANQSMPIKELGDFIRVSQIYKIKFGIQANVHYSDEFNNKMKNSQFMNCFEFVKNLKMSHRKVKANHLLGFFEEKIGMVYKIQTDPSYDGLVIHPFVLQEEDVFFGISKKTSREVYEKLQEAFKKLEQDGTLQSIRKRYLHL
ncbi:substrate-binding periplasmic protein [Psychromonas ossibalaenae]|uniref:substrate-binding periplasmic protein n=1 Tax=Psychromonas ossibalaenae TaxID=444922 RepID=UPI0003688884|nr:transporter substrate-binding domain-containing protein [Psychromonas ossibalaenae]